MASLNQSDSAPGVKLPLYFNVGGVGGVNVVKSAQKDSFLAGINYCHPPTARRVPMNSKFPAFGAANSNTNVLPVDALRGVSKIANSVVAGNAIDVVNDSGRPFSMGVQPCEPVRQVQSFVNRHNHVSARIDGASGAAFGRASSFAKPPEVTRVRVVAKKVAQSFRVKIGCIHEALQMLIGQRPPSDSTHCGGFAILNQRAG